MIMTIKFAILQQRRFDLSAIKISINFSVLSLNFF